MSNLRKIRVGAGLAAALVLALLPPAAHAETATAPAVSAGVKWTPCADTPEVDCGSITVPADWSVKGGPTIRIALARRKASDPAARIGSLLIDPGGPGASGTAVVRGSIGESFSPEVRRRFDLVGLDPRGVGDSTQVLCDQTTTSGVTATDLLLATTAQFNRVRTASRELGQSCRKHSGPVFEALDSKSVARDLDAVRAALGDRKLTFYGISYGTLMGQEYAQLFPQRVRGLVLDSNMDHSRRTTWSFLRSEAAAVQKSFDEYVAWCRRSKACALHGQDVRRVTARLLARAGRGELLEPGTTEPIDQFILLDDIQFSFMNPSWKQLSQRQASLLSGTPTTARAMKTPSQPGSPLSLRTRLATGSGFGSEPAADPEPDPTGIFCSDWRLPIRSAAEARSLRRRLEKVAPDMKIPAQAWAMTAVCMNWPAAVRNPQQPLHRTKAPVLMLNSRFDPVTPLGWARTAARQSGATLLTYDGWGHGVYSMHSSCVSAATERFLTSAKVPAPGTRCAAVDPEPSRAADRRSR